MPEDHLLRESAAVRATPGQGGAGMPADRARLRAPSYAQQRLWFLSRLTGVSEAYHMPLAVELAGPLDRAALARALDALVARHEALRTRFASVAGEPVGVIDQPDRGFALAMDDLSARSS